MVSTDCASRYVEQTEHERFYTYQAAMVGRGSAFSDLFSHSQQMGVDSQPRYCVESDRLGLDVTDAIPALLCPHSADSTPADEHRTDRSQRIFSHLRGFDGLAFGPVDCLAAA